MSLNANGDFDVKGAVDAIGKELFSENKELSPPAKEPDPQNNLDSGESVLAVAENVPGVQPTRKPMPKSWKKELEPEWEKASDNLHEYITQREADFLKGFSQYSDSHKKWNNLWSPYQEMLKQHPNLDPVQLTHGLLNMHIQLLTADPGSRRDLAQQLLKHYEIDLGAPVDSNNELSALRAELKQLKSGVEATQRDAYDRTYREKLSEVQKFAADPVNKYYSEVAEDIGKILKSGIVGNDLAKAYEHACYANPVVRQKVISDLQAAQQAPTGKVTPGSFPNLDSSGVSSRPAKKGTIDQTVDAIVSKHYSNHQH